MMRLSKAASALLIAISLAISSQVFAKEELLVYTAVEPELLPAYKDAFENSHPDLELTYVRDSAGPISARLLAEKDHPKAHVILGLSAIALERLRGAGVLEPYKPQNASALNPKMHADDFSWIGINAWGGSICVNTDLLKKQNLPVPSGWRDLLNPIYKGKIVMPSPVASSTGFMFLLGWIQGMGEEEGWRYVERLHENILFYTSSGARPAAMAAQGEIPIALTSEAFVRPFKRFSIPVTTVEPKEGIAWDAEGCALPHGSPKPEIAKKFLDFCATKPVADIAASFSGIAAIDRFSTEQGRAMAERFLPLDFKSAAAQKSEMLAHWQTIIAR
jgi:iron(III) transport system substrate-binding protein